MTQIATPDIGTEKFCYAYVACNGNAATAVRQAFPEYADAKPDAISSMAKRLLTSPQVQQRIQEITQETFSNLHITAERVKAEIARVAFASVKDIFDENGRLIPIHRMPDDVAATIVGMEVEENVIAASDEVGKHNTKYRHKVPNSSQAGRPRNDEIGLPDVPEADIDSPTGSPLDLPPAAFARSRVSKIRRADKMAALTLLAKHFKLVGDEDEGVNKLAGALADRLNAARQRVPGDLPPIDEAIDDARIIEPAQATPIPGPRPVIDSTENPHDQDALW